ncbi:MAG: tetratricopeptide repeat protein, partial [Limisphaerales bacterium]
AHLDYAGPDRSLGLLYRDAPSFISIGNRSKAREHLRRAVALAPEYPENHLDLIESYLKWEDRTRARKELAALEETLPKAREKFKGPEWAPSWTDWETRLRAVKEKLEADSKLQSPRH